jgi:hypothetical protein
LKLCTWLYIYDLQIKLKNGGYQPIFGRAMLLKLSHFKRFFSCPDFFFAMCAAIALKLCTWLYINDLQIKLKDGGYQAIFWESYAP